MVGLEGHMTDVDVRTPYLHHDEQIVIRLPLVKKQSNCESVGFWFSFA